MSMRSLLLLVLLSAAPATAASAPRTVRRRVPVTNRRALAAFGNPKYFTNHVVPSNAPGVALAVPDFDAVFAQVRAVSPLATQAFAAEEPGGFRSLDGAADALPWKVVARNPQRLVSHIDKIDDFQGKGTPLVRFRATLQGPAKQRGMCFSELVSDAALRRRWDATVAIVQEDYSAARLGDVKAYLRPDQGEPARFGIGYVRTKQSVVSPREQLTLCGLQTFPSGASVLWGIELPEDQNHLFPAAPPKRVGRSTSHLFCSTIIPREGDTFDVEYLVQLEVGGLPGWLTGPAVVETIKKMFRFADGYFKSGSEEGGDLAKRLALFPDEDEAGEEGGIAELSAESISTAISAGVLDQKQTLLMPP